MLRTPCAAIHPGPADMWGRGRITPRELTVDLGLRGSTVLVTGAGQGLGRSLGLAFAAEGADVAFHYRTSGAGAEKAAREAVTRGVRSIAVGADLRDRDQIARALDQVESALGPVTILVNNSAVTQNKPFLETSEDDWEAQIGVTVTGTIRMVRHVVERMVSNGGGGSIVTLMGDSGRVGESRLLVTATARSSTVGLTKSVAKEFARHGIRANAVSIALVRTDSFESHAGGADDERMKKVLTQYPLRRLGTPEDVTPMVLLLASPLSSWTTGQVISVNGGYAMP
ncbi:MAG: SDR family NAD(P)-dependent oxidoreductase [Acidimicrobiales bacterium]